MRLAIRPALGLVLVALLAAGCAKPKDASPEEANLELELPASADPPSHAPDRVSRLTIDGADFSQPRGTARMLKVKPRPTGEVTVAYTFWPNTYTKITRTKVVTLGEGRAKASLLAEDRATPDKVEPIYVPTPKEVVEKMCQMAGIGKDDVVYDIGCGDGRLVIMAVERYGAKKGVGLDINPELIKDCQANARKAGVEKRATFEVKDALTVADFGEASVVLLYLGDHLNNKLKPVLRKTLKKGSRVVSHRFLMKDDKDEWKPDRTETIKAKDNHGEVTDFELHLWTIK